MNMLLSHSLQSLGKSRSVAGNFLQEGIQVFFFRQLDVFDCCKDCCIDVIAAAFDKRISFRGMR